MRKTASLVAVAGAFDVSVRVRNTGRRAGAQIVQAYVGDPAGSGEPPRQLKAFARVELRRGRSRTVRLRLDPSAFQVWDAQRRAWTTPSGRFQIYVGTSSRDLPHRLSVTP